MSTGGSSPSIFVDETMIQIRGRNAWVWVAFEPGLRTFLAFRISYNQSVLDAYLFLKELRIQVREEAHLDGRGGVVSGGVQVGPSRAPRLRDGAQEPHRER